MYTPVPIAVVEALRERIRCLEGRARHRRAVLPFGVMGLAIRRFPAPSPRLPSGRLRPSEPVIGPAKGRTRWTGYGEGQGEGAFPQTQIRDSDSRRRPLTRNLREERANSDLSPQAGRGEAARLSLDSAPARGLTYCML